MTTTELYSGLAEGEKSSSRVLRPPGGGCSNIFGGGEPEPVKVKDYYKSDIFNQKNGDQNSPQAQTAAPKASQTGAAAAPFASEATPTPVEVEKPAPPTPSASNPVAPTPPEPQQAKSRAGVNPITGEVMGQNSGGPHTSTRVRQPPGGASSGPLW